MFEFLTGRVAQLQPGAVVLATGGIGWSLQVSQRTAGILSEGDEAHLFVHLAVSENAMTLYGFADGRERALFRRLLQVSGIGPASALNVLSAFAPDELVQLILDGESKPMTNVKGIGKKTADRLIVDLRDRLTDFSVVRSGAAPGVDGDDLLRLLQDLGFRDGDARTAAAAAREALGESADLEDLLRQALRTS